VFLMLLLLISSSLQGHPCEGSKHRHWRKHIWWMHRFVADVCLYVLIRLTPLIVHTIRHC
jgi:hypothetical protein